MSGRAPLTIRSFLPLLPLVAAFAGSAQAASNVSEAEGKAVINHYADMAFAVFSDALTTARALDAANTALLKQPTEANLQAARTAWLAARVPYMQTEVFRFGNSVVDDWEGQLNAWPLDEGLIDYVAKDYQAALGNPGATANIIANTQLKVGEETLDLTTLTPKVLASLNEIGGSEANVATGYHAIEFLLWGQDLNGTNAGAGQRPVTDFAIDASACTGGHCDRRRQYLTVATQLLVSDLEEMVAEWQPARADNYRARLVAEPVDQGLRKMLFGMGSLSLGELAGERMKVALEANSPEDEHDCFSDNTHHSHFYDAKGIRNIYLGEYLRSNGQTLKGPSLSALVAKRDGGVDKALLQQLESTENSLQKLVDSAKNGVHFDQLIASGNKSGNALVHEGIHALVAQTAGIEAAAKALGINDLNPDTADHSF
jgi:putative iron-regulated protein